MTTPNDTLIPAACALPRRRWITPQIILGECEDSEAGNDVYASDITTTDRAFTGS